MLNRRDFTKSLALIPLFGFVIPKKQKQKPKHEVKKLNINSYEIISENGYRLPKDSIITISTIYNDYMVDWKFITRYDIKEFIDRFIPCNIGNVKYYYDVSEVELLCNGKRVENPLLSDFNELYELKIKIDNQGTFIVRRLRLLEVEYGKIKDRI